MSHLGEMEGHQSFRQRAGLLLKMQAASLKPSAREGTTRKHFTSQHSPEPCAVLGAGETRPPDGQVPTLRVSGQKRNRCTPKGGGKGRDDGPTLQAQEAQPELPREAEAALGRPKTATGEELSGKSPRKGGADEKGGTDQSVCCEALGLIRGYGREGRGG